MKNKIFYSHRPSMGISVAVTNDNSGNLFFAMCITNDGMTKNGNFDDKREDRFSREMSRNILNGRLASLMEGKECDFGLAFYNFKMDARAFVAKFREKFKPDVNEMDSTFCDVEMWNGVEVRCRKSADEIRAIVFAMADEVSVEISFR